MDVFCYKVVSLYKFNPLEIKRKAFNQLLTWKESRNRKPLLLRGARQVGKSYLAKKLGKIYPQFIELNLEKKADYDIFEKESLTEILSFLFLQKNASPHKETLIFIDEIQENPKAIAFLRFFYEDFPEIHVISAGSLLEFALGDIRSFPVGRIEQMAVYPIDFEEFLEASNPSLFQAFQKNPLDATIHTLFLDYFHKYTLVGGMPEVVKKYLTDGNALNLSKIYQNLWQSYSDDVEKYAKNDTEKKILRHILQTAHLEADRIKLQGFGSSNYKSREVGQAFQALQKSKIIQLIYPITSTKLPMLPNLKRSPRLQFLDTGILNFLMGIQAELVINKDFSNLYRGKIIQHIVAQQLESIQDAFFKVPCFWVREKTNSNAEVDIVFPFDSQVVPIEIKSGKTGKMRSLYQFIDESDIHFGIRLHANTFSVEKIKTIENKEFTLINLPYYAAIKIEDVLRFCKENSLL